MLCGAGDHDQRLNQYLKKGRERSRPLSFVAIPGFSFVIPGRAKREPGIHPDTSDADQWIPGLRLAAHPGM